MSSIPSGLALWRSVSGLLIVSVIPLGVHRLERDRLKGTQANAINALLRAAAMNFQKAPRPLFVPFTPLSASVVRRSFFVDDGRKAPFSGLTRLRSSGLRFVPIGMARAFVSHAFSRPVEILRLT